MESNGQYLVTFAVPTQQERDAAAAAVADEERARKKGAWSYEEDELLRRVLSELGFLKEGAPHSSWSTVAGYVKGRTAKQCRERWCYNLDPSIRKAPWTDGEDRTLLDTHRELGNRWAQIASQLPGRTENSVKTRYKSLLRAKRREWTVAEDELVLKLHRTVGCRWDLIAESLSGRTKNAVKTRYRLLMRGEAHKQRLEDKLGPLPALGSRGQIPLDRGGQRGRPPHLHRSSSGEDDEDEDDDDDDDVDDGEGQHGSDGESGAAASVGGLSAALLAAATGAGDAGQRRKRKRASVHSGLSSSSCSSDAAANSGNNKGSGDVAQAAQMLTVAKRRASITLENQARLQASSSAGSAKQPAKRASSKRQQPDAPSSDSPLEQLRRQVMLELADADAGTAPKKRRTAARKQTAASKAAASSDAAPQESIAEQHRRHQEMLMLQQSLQQATSAAQLDPQLLASLAALGPDALAGLMTGSGGAEGAGSADLAALYQHAVGLDTLLRQKPYLLSAALAIGSSAAAASSSSSSSVGGAEEKPVSGKTRAKAKRGTAV